MTHQRRAWEELTLGETRASRLRRVSPEEIITFARQYDPQWFHTDPAAARESVFGEVVASGIHVLALWRQLDHEINADIDFVCGVGWEELRLLRAVRGGDTIRATSALIALAPSRSGRPRGSAVHRYSVELADGTPCLTFLSTALVYTRAAQAARQPAANRAAP